MDCAVQRDEVLSRFSEDVVVEVCSESRSYWVSSYYYFMVKKVLFLKLKVCTVHETWE